MYEISRTKTNKATRESFYFNDDDDVNKKKQTVQKKINNLTQYPKDWYIYEGVELIHDRFCLFRE